MNPTMNPVLAYLATVLIWGSTWYAITFQLGVVDPAWSLVYRFGLACLLLLTWCVARGLPMRYSWREHGWMALQGLCLFSLNYLLFYWCTGYITSGLVAVIFSTVIVMNILNGALFLGRPIVPAVVVGALLGLLGIGLLFWHEIERARAVSVEAAGQLYLGLGIGLVATLLASLGNIASARNQRDSLPVVQTNAYGMGYGTLAMLVYVLATGAPLQFDTSPGYLLSLVYLSVFGSIIAFGAYLSLVGRIGADRAAYATVLFPVVALVISGLFEGFVWGPAALAGVALVLLGNALVVGRKALGAAMVRLRRSARAAV